MHTHTHTHTPSTCLSRNVASAVSFLCTHMHANILFDVYTYMQSTYGVCTHIFTHKTPVYRAIVPRQIPFYVYTCMHKCIHPCTLHMNTHAHTQNTCLSRNVASADPFLCIHMHANMNQPTYTAYEHTYSHTKYLFVTQSCLGRSLSMYTHACTNAYIHVHCI